MSTTEECTEQAHAMILHNRSVPITEVVHQLHISNGSALGIIQGRLGFHNIITEFLDIIHRSVFYLEHNVSETGFCVHLQVKAYSIGPNR
jgi:hypothetical protein